MSAISSVSNSAEAGYASQLEQTSAFKRGPFNIGPAVQSVGSDSSSTPATFIGGGSIASPAPINPLAAEFGHLLTYLPDGNTSPPDSVSSATDGLDTTA
jgi:hypothetical protein